MRGIFLAVDLHAQAILLLIEVCTLRINRFGVHTVRGGKICLPGIACICRNGVYSYR